MKRTLHSVFVILTIGLIAGAAVPCARGQEVVMTNINIEQQYSMLRITYDLVGEEDDYAINLLLRNKEDASYSYAPKGMRGDIGEEVTPGRGKVIEWDVAKDFPHGIDPSTPLALSFEARYYFGFFQKYTPYLVGTAAVVGAAVYFLLSGDEEESEFPDPSGRPGGW